MLPHHPPSTLFPYTTLFRSQSLGPHDAEGPHVSGGATHREPALHTHLFVLAEPGGTLVFEVRARCDCARTPDRKSTRLNSSHTVISYAVFCLKKKKKKSQIG